MSQEKIYKELLSYLDNDRLKDFEKRINELFKIKENKENSQLLNLYGLFCEIKKEFNKALNLYVKSINLNPKFTPPFFNLGRLYLHFKMYKPSIDFLKKYLESNTEGHFEAEYFLSRAYYFNYQYDEAIDLLKKIYKKYQNDLSDTQLVEILNLLGSAYTLNKDIDNAIQNYQKALEIDKNNVITLGNLANAFRSQDKKDDALNMFKQTLKLDPKNPHLHKDLSVLIKYQSENDEHLNQMLNLYKEKNYPSKDKADLGFAIGKAYDDLKLPEKASKFLIPSNNERRSQFKYDFNHEVKEFKLHSTVFTNIKNRILNDNLINPIPIFILGMPRSGTTLVEQILSSHSKIEAGDEIFFLANAVQKAIPHKSFDDFPKSFNDDTEAKLKNFSKLYSNELKKISNNKNYVTDKMPLNFKLIGLIYHTFPGAKIIHCVRDGRDVCLSIYKNNFGTDKLAWAYDQDELSKFYNLYVDYMKLWKNLYEDFIFDLKYESMVNDTETQVKSLLKFCGLDFEKNCLNFYQNKRAVQTASTMQVRQPIYSSSVKAWKSYEPFFPKLFKNIKDY